VYRFFRDELKTPYLQFIPIVERAADTGSQEGGAVTERSVKPESYGRFLIEIFDEWVKRDVGAMFVQTFDGVLVSWLRGGSSLCVFQPTCGQAVALEHNGDLYSCDHFVDPSHRLGNIMQTPLADLVLSEKQRQFGQAKSATLPGYCGRCEFLFACHGECPRNRVLTTPDGQAGLNWLCAGLKAFFAHTREPMRIMAELLRRGQEAGGIMRILAQQKGAGPQTTRFVGLSAGRNELCPCGSGRKFKKCHGRT
jgi:uncharacterized protein